MPVETAGNGDWRILESWNSCTGVSFTNEANIFTRGDHLKCFLP